MDPVEQIKSRISIEDLIREYVEIKKAGANYKALCPFHSEKSPSFMISLEKQIWHCFGCNQGGDIFGFIMRVEGVEFPEALKFLAQKAGVELKNYDTKISSQKSKLLDILEEAVSFYKQQLPKFASATNYVTARGILLATCNEFKLGFAPNSWSELTAYLKGRGYKDDDIVLAGLAIKKENGGIYDRFRGRIMFPIFNHYGNVIGFTARVLPELDDGKSGKYINTPETAIYKKSAVVYGLNFAKNAIRTEDRVVVVEGNMDVISLHQAGFKNIVATSGTALTDEQVALLKRYTSNFVFCFDFDSAGLEAAYRGIDVALSHDCNVKICNMPKNEAGEPIAKDPDELVKKSPELWHKAVNNPLHIIEFHIENNIYKYKLNDPLQNARFCDYIMAQISKLKNSAERSLWINKLSLLTQVGEAELLGRITFKNKARNTKTTQPVEEKLSDWNEVEARFTSLLLINNSFAGKAVKELAPEALGSKELQDFYRHIIIHYNDNNDFSYNSFKEWYGTLGKNTLILDKLQLLKDREYGEYDGNALDREFKSILMFLKNIYIKEQKKILGIAMAGAERVGDKAKINEILNKFNQLN